MAIARNDPYTRVQELERYCKAEWDDARYQGDTQRADMIYDYFHKRKAEIEMNAQDVYNSTLAQMAQNAGMGQLGIANGTTGISQQYQNALMNQQIYGTGAISNAMAAQQVKSDFKPEFGVLYMHNKELPEDWSGAKITAFSRRVTDKWWSVEFVSKWDKALDIRLYLDIEEHSGKEVNDMARTYMEALNQRRVG